MDTRTRIMTILLMEKLDKNPELIKNNNIEVINK